MAVETMELSLKPNSKAAMQARDLLWDWSGLIDRESLADVRTVVSELVALSVMNGASDAIDLRLEIDDGHAAGAIVDQGPAARVVQETDVERSWALQIVQGLVEEWGPNPERTAVWFRMKVRRVDG